MRVAARRKREVMTGGAQGVGSVLGSFSARNRAFRRETHNPETA